MFTVEKHLWRTEDGRLVETGHPDAAVLAFAAGTELADAVAEQQGLKSKPKPSDKAMPAPSNKGAEKKPA